MKKSSGWLTAKQLEMRDEATILLEKAKDLMEKADKIIVDNEMDYNITAIINDVAFALKRMKNQ